VTLKIERTHTDEVFAMDVKRFRLPCLIIAECPGCLEEKTVDLTFDYLSYPLIGSPFDYSFCCEFCDHEWSVVLQLNVSLVEVESDGREAEEV